MTQALPEAGAAGPLVGPTGRLDRYAEVRVLVEWVVGVVLAATLVAYMVLGNFTRYVQDDFLSTIDDRVYGFWSAQFATYRRHDGHFLGTALQDAAGMLSETFARVLPGLLIVIWVALLALALRRLAPAAGRLGSLLIAAGVVYTTLRTTPNPFLSLYWMTASLAYVVPLLFAAALVWLISGPGVHGRRRPVIAVAVVAFLAAGLAEEYTAAQTVALSLAVLLAATGLSPAWRQRLSVLVAALVGSLVGLGLMLASPGNALRSAAIAKIVGPRPSLFRLPGFTFNQMLQFFHAWLGDHWRGLLAVALLAALIGARSSATNVPALRSALITVALTLVGAVVVVFAAMAPAAYEQAQLPHDYAQIVLVYTCVCATVVTGWVGGRVLRSFVDEQWRRRGLAAGPRSAAAVAASLVVAAVVVIGPIATLAGMRHDLPSIRSYASAKDAEENAALAAHAAGRSSVTVPPVSMLNRMGIFSHGIDAELQSDATYWLNQDEAIYWGITNIATSQPPSP